MAQRRAPATGYDYGNKRQYRRTIWHTFRKGWQGHCAEVDAMLMPSLEGDEIEVALAAGFRQEHLHIVDRNRAIVATLKRRYPKINTYGVTVAQALYRMAERGIELACANFDFCGCLSRYLYQELFLCSQFPVWRDQAVVAVTVLRGREKLVLSDILTKMCHLPTATPRDGLDWGRLLTLGSALSNWRLTTEEPWPAVNVQLLRSGTYRSAAGSQTMLWAIYLRMPWSPKEEGFLQGLANPCTPVGANTVAAVMDRFANLYTTEGGLRCH